MTHPAWARLDNASNIFLAARSDSDPKVFRITAEVDEEVDSAALQRALDATYDRYRLYHSVLRGGIFWYYLQESAICPRVSPELEHTCAPVYQEDRRTLLFRVIYHRTRISLEIFHALSDGTGALWFLTDLVTAYLAAQPGDEPSATKVDREAPGLPPHSSERVEPVHELGVDSFSEYFRRRRGHRAPPEFAEVAPLAEPAETRTVAVRRTPAAAIRWLRSPRRRVHRVRGTRTPDRRTRVIELTMPAADVLRLARAERVSLTMYLTGVFFAAIRAAAGPVRRDTTLAASVPVNLRQFFPSTSARNFFATVRVEHPFGTAADDLGAMCRELERQFRPKATPEALEKKLRRFLRFERMPLLRILPRVLKDVLLRAINHGNNRGLSVAVSNLGRVVVPPAAEDRVGRMLFHVSAVRPQFCAMSHAGLLTISFTSPFVETDHVREFARTLSARGVPVTVAAARVTSAELAGADAHATPGARP